MTKAIILAAGQGTRLKKYTKDLPKGMLNFMGKTIIERQIELYRNAGIGEIIVIKGFAADKINYEGLKYYTNENYATTNMVESFLVAREEFHEDVLVSYSDILFDQSILEKMIRSEADFAVAVDDNWKAYWLERYGSIECDTESLVIDDQDHIVSIGKENPTPDEMHARYIGLLKFSKNGLKKILELWRRDYPQYQNRPWMQSKKNIRQAYMTDLLQALIAEGELVKAERFNNGWIELDTNEDYEKALGWAETGKLMKFVKLV